MRIERRGDCNRCGLCCVGSDHLIVLEGKTIGEADATSCPVWDTDYKDWPARPAEIVPGCAYYFVLVDEEGQEHYIPPKFWDPRRGRWWYAYWDPEARKVGMTPDKTRRLDVLGHDAPRT